MLRALGRPFRAAGREAAPPRRILFIKMIEQGATVLAYRALQRAVEMVGRENVYFWVFEENRPILDILDVIPAGNIFSLRAKSLPTLAADLARSLWRIRRLGIDAVVDMEFFSRASAIFAFLSGARRRVGLHRFTTEGPYRGDLMTHRVQYNPYVHTAAAYWLLVESLLADAAERPLIKRQAPALDFAPPRFRPGDAERSEVRGILARCAGRPVQGPIILLNPNASDLLPLRKWPTERYIELAKLILRDEPAATLAITGAPSERDAAEAVARQIGSERVVSLAGHTTLRQLLVLYTLADVLVTNDSGPGHFSSLTDVDTLVLFGPETPALFGPLGPRSHAVWANVACSPCVNAMNHRFSPCNNNVCMQQISVADVHARVRELLRRRQDQRSN
jgi:ADP-heptose:LPS heptosyltransferase